MICQAHGAEMVGLDSKELSAIDILTLQGIT